MAHFSPSRAMVGLVRGLRRLDTSDPLMQCLAPRSARAFATQTELPVAQLAEEFQSELNLRDDSSSVQSVSSASQILTTLYSWPQLEPIRYAGYNPQLLGVPLRRDILHRAVIYEGDMTRQGTASTKYRDQVHGSKRKIAPQKGLGRARVGDKQSPIRRGGGVTFGPHPRDFSTELPRKIYDLAWRTALSYRYRKGELIVIDGTIDIPPETGGRLLSNIFESNKWGKGFGRSTLVTEVMHDTLLKGMSTVDEHGLVKDIVDIDVKDLLETGRIIVEKDALDCILMAHSSDIGPRINVQQARGLFRDSFVHQEGVLKANSDSVRMLSRPLSRIQG